MSFPKVSVIIPFFQEEKGILIEAARSVLNQKNFNNFEIIVVDDGSPVTANEELANLTETGKAKIKIIRQENAGPGAARNKGLDNVSKDIEYVAFLDSDDVWKDSHLENAIYALGKGYDFYFANFIPLITTKPQFDFRSFEVETHNMVDKERGLYEFKGDFFTFLLQKNIIGTSTVVYRYGKFPFLHFHKKLFNGEDYIFWLELSKLINKPVFSTNVECYYKEGINICSKSGWNSDRAVNYSYESMKFNTFILKHFKFNQEQRKIINKRIDAARHNFIASLLHDVRKKRNFPFDILLKQLRLDILTLPFIFSDLIRITGKKLFK